MTLSGSDRQAGSRRRIPSSGDSSRSRMAPAPGAVEEQFDVTAQMIDRLGGELGSTSGFRKNESALQHSLSVQSQAASRPSCLDAVRFDRGSYIRLDLCGMTADRARAS